MVEKKRRIRSDYNRTAGAYDRRYGSRQFGKYNIMQGIVTGGTVVDLGGGSGLLGRYLNRTDLINVDISFEMLRLSSEANVCGDLDFIPLKKDCADAVLSFTVVQNLPDFSRVFAEVRRILKPGGVFLCSVLRKELDVSDLVKEAKLAGFRVAKKGVVGEDCWFVFI